MGLGSVATPWLEIGWSAQPRMTTELTLQALLAGVWRRTPKTRVMIDSDQGSQFTSREWQVFLGQHNCEASMRRRGNCHDRAIAALLVRAQWRRPSPKAPSRS
jgi:transposase InsO family protein